MKRVLLLLLTAFALSASADEPMLKATPYVYVKSSIGKGKPYFLEIGSDSCRSCIIMGKLLYKVKQRHQGYQIAFINVQKERHVAQELQVRMIPTQIIYDKKGSEVYRHIGPLGTDELLGLFKKYGFAS